MPSRERVQEFIGVVESGDHVGAIERFYAEDASMQENGAPPRVGLRTLVEHERAALARMKRIDTHRVKTFLVDGDFVVINWIFEITDGAGVTRTLDELTLQEWRGDKVFRERFYYDPAQMRPATS